MKILFLFSGFCTSCKLHRQNYVSSKTSSNISRNIEEPFEEHRGTSNHRGTIILLVARGFISRNEQCSKLRSIFKMPCSLLEISSNFRAIARSSFLDHISKYDYKHGNGEPICRTTKSNFIDLRRLFAEFHRSPFSKRRNPKGRTANQTTTQTANQSAIKRQTKRKNNGER